MMTRNLALAGAAIVIALGLGLKAQRYAGQFEDRQAEDLQRIAAFVAPGGWSPVPHTGTPLPFAFVTFAKPGRARKLTVVPLGSSRELVDEVRLALGSDVGFVETGKSVPRGWAALFAPAPSALGLLAMSPAPAAGRRPWAPGKKYEPRPPAR